MCGICGAIGFRNAFSLVQRMSWAMVHRGPDNDGFINDGYIALGIRRLKIIDLNTGDQPIYNEDRTVGVVCNGEIYNFRELYRELQALGHQFSTCSDTEVIVHAYEEWSADCLKHLRGMFALAIYDRRHIDNRQTSGRLLLARDRLGIKPLYLWQNGAQLMFASEVRALLSSGKIPKKLSTGGLFTYLAFGSVQEPLTMIDGVNSLAPASWLQIEFGNEQLDVTQGVYWRPPLNGDDIPSLEEVRSWLTDAVRSHLISDVTLGAFLSGGLDSASIVALGSQELGEAMRTFTLSFDNWEADERELAEKTAQRWHTNHQCRVINQKEFSADLPQAISGMDQPTVDGINTWYVSREAKRSGLKVALSGIGGDELFAGYPSFRQVPRLKRLPRMGRWIANLPVWGFDSSWIPGSVDSRGKLVAFLVNDMPVEHPYFAVRGLFPQPTIRKLLQPSVYEYLQVEGNPLRQWRENVAAQQQIASNYDAIGEISWLELSQYMRSTLLRDTDMMSMAHSLEVRVPLVDHVLVDKILPIRGKNKLQGGKSKPLLVGALKNLLPPELTTNTKHTFTFPFEVWLREGLSQEMGKSLHDVVGGLGTWLDPAVVSLVWQDFERGKTNWARPWSLYILDAWIRRHL